ncbi:MAG: GMC oxidoreductase [Pseudomonadota bacterium]
MSVSDSSVLFDSAPKQFDLIVIGSGPAGLTLAHELKGTGLAIAVLESGSQRRSAHSSALNKFENIGHSRKSFEISRCRGIGGTSQLWTGQCGVFEEIDYHARDWVPHSGWPIEHATLKPYFNRAGAYLGIKETIATEKMARELWKPFDDPPWDREMLSQVAFQISRNTRHESPLLKGQPDYEISEDLFEDFVHHVGSNAMDFGANLVDAIAASDNVQLFTDATVVEVLANPTGTKAEGVRIKRFDQRELEMSARAIVVACGGIENARLLLASRASAPNGLGNAHDQVGRYLTDHPSAPVANYRNGRGGALRRRLGSRWHPAHGRGHIHKLGPRLSPDVQAREKLLNAAFTYVEVGGDRNALTTLARGARGLKSGGLGKETRADILAGLLSPVDLARAAKDRYFANTVPLDRPSVAVIGCFVEQQLDPESRVSLSEQTDALGQHISKIDWRVSEAEFRTALRASEILYTEIDRLGYEAPERPAWLDDGFQAWKDALADRSHPMCSTRMSDDPRRGVVDANCKVHGVDALYVAGGSVFSTPGFANPTQMLVALSVRLAERLKLELSRSVASATVRQKAPVRVGFIGGGDRVTNVYSPVLEALGEAFEVAGVVTRTSDTAKKFEAMGWGGTTDLEGFVKDRNPDFLVVSVPGDKIDQIYPKALSLRVPLLLETPIAWSDWKGRKLLKKINKSKVMVGVAEQFPLLPEIQLWKKVIALGVIGTPVAVSNNFSLYDYHGLAVLRALLGPDRSPRLASAVHSRIDADENWLVGAIQNRDNSLINYNYSATYARSPKRPEGTIEVVGTAGTLSSRGLITSGDDGAVFQSQIERDQIDGKTNSLWLETPLGRVTWTNDLADYALTDHQIAVARLMRGMRDAVLYGGVPDYSAAEALTDVEYLAAMRHSARRSGAPIAFPYSAASQKLRAKAGL